MALRQFTRAFLTVLRKLRDVPLASTLPLLEGSRLLSSAFSLPQAPVTSPQLAQSSELPVHEEHGT